MASTLSSSTRPPSPQPFSEHTGFLRSATAADIERELAAPHRLRLAEGRHGPKTITVAYAPFDHLNPEARVVIVGLTPGRQQARNALEETRRLLQAGASEAEAMARAKVFASFSGPMRANLVAMLDDVGLARRLGLGSTEALWGSAQRLVHFTSALRYPVFVDGQNYSGAPDILSTPLLREQLLRWFAREMEALPHAVFVPLGPKVAAAVEWAAREAGVDAARILAGLPHPSGANGERIAFFLGRKLRAALSSKVDPDKLLAARASVEARVRALGDMA